jgi:hypothetical protein
MGVEVSGKQKKLIRACRKQVNSNLPKEEASKPQKGGLINGKVFSFKFMS